MSIISQFRLHGEKEQLISIASFLIFSLIFILPFNLLGQRQAIYQYSATNPYRVLYSLDNEKYTTEWKLDKVAFYAFVSPVSGSVPVYQYHAEAPLRFYYSTDPGIQSGWSRDGVAFYANSYQEPESVPVYEFSALNPMRFLYSTSKKTGPGWDSGRKVFWAYLTQTPKFEVIAKANKSADNPTIESNQPVAVVPAYGKDPLNSEFIPLPEPEHLPEQVNSLTSKSIVSIANDGPKTIPVYEYVAEHPKRYNYSLVDNPDEGWEKVTVAFYAYQYKEKGTMPVYRYYTNNPWRFFYSYDPDIVTENSNWKKDWVAFYAFKYQENGTVPVYQYFAQNPLRYMYSTNTNMDKPGWTYDKVAFYAMPGFTQ